MTDAERGTAQPQQLSFGDEASMDVDDREERGDTGDVLLAATPATAPPSVHTKQSDPMFTSDQWSYNCGP